METKKQKIQDHGLWIWSHEYVFDDGKCYLHETTASAKDVARYMGFPITQEVINAINQNCEYFRVALEDDDAFNDWLIEQEYEYASRAYYEGW